VGNAQAVLEDTIFLEDLALYKDTSAWFVELQEGVLS
jgi:hypothetical protein